VSQSPNRLLGIFLGIVYILDGIYGFFLTSETAFFATSGPKVFDLFEINPFHNLVHLVVGLALLVSALVGARPAKAMNTTLGAIFLLVGVVGLLLSSGNNNVLNFASAVLLLCVGLGADRATAKAKTA
jgi:hypothetical protein